MVDEPTAHFAVQLKHRSVLELDCHADCQVEPEGQVPAGWHLVQNPLTLRGQIPWAPSHSHAEIDDLPPDGNGYNASFPQKVRSSSDQLGSISGRLDSRVEESQDSAVRKDPK